MFNAKYHQQMMSNFYTVITVIITSNIYIVITVIITCNQQTSPNTEPFDVDTVNKAKDKTVVFLVTFIMTSSA